MASAFSSPENEVLERNVLLDEEICATFENIWGYPQKELCIKWIKKNCFERVCLQFPDNFLEFSSKICDELKAECEAKFFILADTSYGSCCVDEIAAAHVDADSIVHFGIACHSKASRLPVMNLFPRFPLDVDKMCEHFQERFEKSDHDQPIYIYFDTGYQYVIEEEGQQESILKIRKSLSKFSSIEVRKFSDNIDDKDKVASNIISIFVGQDNQAFFNKSMSVKAGKWFIYDPDKNSFDEKNPLATNWIKRRYFYIEKCKDARTLGLIVATLSTDGYLDVVKHIQQMARSRDIRTHIISVGRINPSKLANFMEIDCFVLIGCPFNNMYTSRDFYKPIISVFEAEMALNPAWHLQLPDTYATDFQDILPNGKLHRELEDNNLEHTDVSLITGRMRNIKSDNTNVYGDNSSNVLTERRNYQLMETTGENSFDSRSWKGLDQALGRTEPAKIEMGLSGIPIKYTHE